MMFGLEILVFGAIAYALGWRPNLSQFQSQPPTQSEGSVFEILKARYARGEISREDYEQAKRDLES